MELAKKLNQIFLKIIDWFLVEPKRLVRLVVLSICSIIVFFQLWECVMKLLNPPISTHSHFDLNQTMHYPAVTFCREPGFKEFILTKYNLSYSPSITSSWDDFDFDSSSITQLFDEATYSRDEIFEIYALDGNRSNVEVEETIHFSLGRCYTIKPKVSTIVPWKKSGYCITLRHDFMTPEEEQENAKDPPGFHVYLHEPRERFTEHGILSSGRIEYLYLQANEEMELKLSAQHFHQFKGRGASCSEDMFKSRSICHEICRWNSVEAAVACSGPWMTRPETPQCNNSKDIQALIYHYKYSKRIDGSDCECVEPCYSIIYSAFVQSRRPFKRAEPGSKIYIYYTSKMVTNIEELAGYDWSQFVADMGGSVGFLLGLSIIAVIVVLEKILGHLFLNKFIERYKEKQQKRIESEQNYGNEKRDLKV